MDFRRISLMAALAVVTYLLILNWSNDYATTPASTSSASAPASAVVSDNGVATTFNDDIPSGNTITANGEPQPTAVSSSSSANTSRVSVTTDVINAEIDLIGGDVVFAALPKFPVSIDLPDQPLAILENVNRTYLAQSGLVGQSGIDTGERAQYSAQTNSYTLQPGQDTLEVVLSHTSDTGIVVDKIYTFTAGSYLIDIRYDITNTSSESAALNLFAQIRRDGSEDPSSGGGIGMRSFLGATFSTQAEPYQKVSFSDMGKKAFAEVSNGGWVAFMQHYFITAFIPSQTDLNSFYAQQGRNGQYYAGYQAPMMTVAPGESVSTGTQLYVGPKDQDALYEIAPNLEKTVDYGWLWWIATPLFKLMQLIHSVVGNWGWSIVILTIIVKMALYPLTAKSYRSMAKMKKFAPKIQELREQFGDDRQRMSQEMMKLYQKEKLNPLGGCLPILVQMPIFIALYWVLMESVELRQAPFMFWIYDLSIKDPFFVLPLLMGASMFLQMQMQQQPTMDPMQAKIMKFMPVMFTFMFLWFPAGLTLYWFVNNVITIIQQFVVNKSVEKAEAKSA